MQEYSKTQFENFLEYHERIIMPSKFLTKRRLL